jgi:hypothetical protein
MDVRVCAWMDLGWTWDGWMGRWVDGWKDERKEARASRARMCACVRVRMNA